MIGWHFAAADVPVNDFSAGIGSCTRDLSPPVKFSTGVPIISVARRGRTRCPPPPVAPRGVGRGLAQASAGLRHQRSVELFCCSVEPFCPHICPKVHKSSPPPSRALAGAWRRTRCPPAPLAMRDVGRGLAPNPLPARGMSAPGLDAGGGRCRHLRGLDSAIIL